MAEPARQEEAEKEGEQLTISQLQSGICLALSCCAIGCGTTTAPASNAPIITKYKTADCLPFSRKPKVKPHTREWNALVLLHDGMPVSISGAQIPGGRIAVSYPGSNRQFLAADPGDYIYPSDVRLDAPKETLYVKAHGLAGGISEQTWLFAYNLRARRIVERVQVKNDVLPAECQEPPRLQ
jgi:hypothetical protein